MLLGIDLLSSVRALSMPAGSTKAVGPLLIIHFTASTCFWFCCDFWALQRGKPPCHCLPPPTKKATRSGLCTSFFYLKSWRITQGPTFTGIRRLPSSSDIVPRKDGYWPGGSEDVWDDVVCVDTVYQPCPVVVDEPAAHLDPMLGVLAEVFLQAPGEKRENWVPVLNSMGCHLPRKLPSFPPPLQVTTKERSATRQNG